MDASTMSRKDLQSWLKVRKLPASGTTAALREAYSMAASGVAIVASSSSTTVPKVPAPTQEKRIKRYRSAPTSGIRQRISRASNQRLYLVQKGSPDAEHKCAFVVLGSTGNVYTVTLQKVPHCSCPDHAKGNLCKHILFVLLKVVGLAASSPLVYQQAYLTSELQQIYALLRDRRVGGSSNVMAKKSVQKKYASLQNGGGDTAEDEEVEDETNRKSLDADSDCPICFDTMTEGAELTYCRGTCGANFHTACIERWLSQTTRGPATCPNCRQEWVDPSKQKEGHDDEGYANLGDLQGQSPVRDTSSYSQRSHYSNKRYRRYY